ncbi:MAG: putative glycoside hydrolase [Anaerolineae bacterium]
MENLRYCIRLLFTLVAVVAGLSFTARAYAGAPEYHVVQPGDTLWGIARRYKVSPAALLVANTDIHPAEVLPGDRLTIPDRSPPAAGATLRTTGHGQPAAFVLGRPIKALYITYYGIGHKGLRSHVQELLRTTELNAVVIDVKGDRGYIPYRSDVPLAGQVGAQPHILVEDWGELMTWFREHNIYTIARIVVFKDDPLAATRLEWAVLNSETGEPWRDREGLAWADPFQEEVWDYNVAIAVEAAGKGFDEIQFDYLRFPTDGNLKTLQFSQENTEANRRAAIVGFLERAHQALAPTGVRIAADVFGYTTWRKDDTGIGQVIEEMADYIDVLSPMLYPSTFHAGLPGYPVAVPYPYETVFLSTRRAVERLDGTGVEVRPWIQDFPDYAFDKRVYTPDEIRAQMRAALNAGAGGWMLWDPRVRYTIEALMPAAH